VNEDVERRLMALENGGGEGRLRIRSVGGAGTVPGVMPGALDHDGTTVGFYGATPAAKPTVTGAKGANAALTSLLAALVTLGLITDTTTA
jgi:hypothetical protein